MLTISIFYATMADNPLFGDDVEAIKDYLKDHPDELNKISNHYFETPIAHAAKEGKCDVVSFYLFIGVLTFA